MIDGWMTASKNIHIHEKNAIIDDEFYLGLFSSVSYCFRHKFSVLWYEHHHTNTKTNRSRILAECSRNTWCYIPQIRRKFSFDCGMYSFHEYLSQHSKCMKNFPRFMFNLFKFTVCTCKLDAFLIYSSLKSSNLSNKNKQIFNICALCHWKIDE